jgi:hypothetical protein
VTKPALKFLRDEATIPATGIALNVVVAYEDLPAGKRAMRVLDRPAHEFEAAIQFRPKLWRFDFLEDLNWRNLTTADVLNADMLVISQSSEDELPAWFQSWACACLSQMHDRIGAVVALLGNRNNADAPAVWRLLWLQEAAREAGLAFFSSVPADQPSLRNRSPGLEEVEKVTRSPVGIMPLAGRQEFEVPVPIFSRTLDQVTAYQHWGIND